MFCPKCRSEFVPSITYCQNCEVELVAALPAVDAFATPEGMAALLAERELAAVMTGTHTELQKVQRLLADERLASVIAGDPDQDPSEAAMHPRFFLMVAAEESEQAMQLYHQNWRDGMAVEGTTNEATMPASADVCPACGTSVPENVAECPECGLFLGDGGDVG